MFRLSILVLTFTLFACSPAERPVEELTATSSGPEADAPVEPSRYNEYLWCKEGENFSEESLANLTQTWLGMSNEAGVEYFGVYSLSPRFTDPNFDRILLLVWPDKETRDKGWETYSAENIQAKLDEQYPGVEQCGGDNWANVYGNTVYQPRVPSVTWDVEKSPTALVGYRFCSYNAGKEPKDLRQLVRGKFDSWLVEYEEGSGPSSYNWGYLAPDFDVETIERNEGVPPTFDYVWMDFWANPTEAESGNASWAETGFQSEFDAVATCTEPQSYDLVETRRMRPSA